MFYLDPSFQIVPPRLLGCCSAIPLDVTVVTYRHHPSRHCLVVTMYIPPPSTTTHGHMIWINSRNSYLFNGPLVHRILAAGFVLYVVDPPSHGMNQNLGPSEMVPSLSYENEFEVGLDFVCHHVIGHNVVVRAMGEKSGASLLLRYQERHQLFESLCLFSPLIDIHNVTCRRTLSEQLWTMCGGKWFQGSSRWSHGWLRSRGYEIDPNYYPVRHSSYDILWFREIVARSNCRSLIRCPVCIIIGDLEPTVYIALTKQMFHRSCPVLEIRQVFSCERCEVIIHDDVMSEHLPEYLSSRKKRKGQ